MKAFIPLHLFAMGLILAPLQQQFGVDPQTTRPVLTATVRVPSSSCLACHDGSSGPVVDPATSHAFDVDYRAAQSIPGRSLRNASLPSGFGSTIEQDFLLDGRVECTSCHYTHEEQTSNKFRLKIGGNTTPLCLACHDMKGR